MSDRNPAFAAGVTTARAAADAARGRFRAARAFTPGKSSAFTLIELLVVIAIIALLAAILFPVFANARAKAREVTCVSNLRQVGMAVRMYVQDYDETFPIFHAYNFKAAGMPGPGEPGHKGVEDQVLPYAKATGIFRCPDDTGSPVQEREVPGSESYWQAYGSSYRFMAACFTRVHGADGSYQNNAPLNPASYSAGVVTDAEFVYPAETRIMRDEQFPWFSRAKDPSLQYGYDYDAPWDYYRQWHGNGGGLVFADGHAKFYASEGAFQKTRATPDGKSFPECWFGCE